MPNPIERAVPGTGEYHSPEFLGLEARMTEIFRQMAEKGDPSSYSLVVGDDFSGRIPMYVAINVLRKISGSSKPHGVLFDPKPETNIRTVVQNFRENARRIDFHEGDRILFVTDYILSGKTVERMRDVFVEQGIKFDVASIYLVKTEKWLRRRQIIPDDTMVFGGKALLDLPDTNIPKNHNIVGLPAGDLNTLSGNERLVRAKETKEDIATLSGKIVKNVFGFC